MESMSFWMGGGLVLKATSLSEIEEALRETLTILSSPWLIRASLWLSFCSNWFRVFQYACKEGEEREKRGEDSKDFVNVN